MGSIVARCLFYCARESAPPWQAFIGSVGIGAIGVCLLSSVVGSHDLLGGALHHEDGDWIFWALGILISIYALAIFATGCQKAFIDLSPGAHVTWISNDADIRSGDVGRVVERIGAFPIRCLPFADNKVRVKFRGQVFLMKPYELRSTDKQPTEDIEGSYTPPTLQQPENVTPMPMAMHPIMQPMQPMQQQPMAMQPMQSLTQPMQQHPVPMQQIYRDPSMMPTQQMSNPGANLQVPRVGPQVPPLRCMYPSMMPTQQTSNPGADLHQQPMTQPIAVQAAPKTLDAVLKAAAVNHVSDAIVGLGVTEVDDFVDVTDEDLQECGLKPIEIKRLRRHLASQER
jgi:hypothetical protein